MLDFYNHNCLGNSSRSANVEDGARLDVILVQRFLGIGQEDRHARSRPPSRAHISNNISWYKIPA